MKNWFSNIFGKDKQPGAPIQADSTRNVLDLQRENQSLRMELEARQQRLSDLKAEIERLRARQEQQIAETVESRLVSVFSDLATPASQILTQAHLLENQGQNLQARDVLPVARRMVRAIERHGVTFDGEIGQAAEFDPNRHTPIQGGSAPQPGQAVTIRFAGVMYQGRVLSKAVVE